MRVGIMQPYFLPYIGYFQLMNHCDAFVVYDDIEYTKRGWINRNRILVNGQPYTFTLPLTKDSDYLAVRDRFVAPVYDPTVLIRRFDQAYSRAPHWSTRRGRIEEIAMFEDRNLFEFLWNSLHGARRLLEIETPLIRSSTLGIDPALRGIHRVLAICASLEASEYVNPIGGLALYEARSFQEQGVELTFLRSRLSPYEQFAAPFVEALSIVDALAFVAPSELSTRIATDFDIVRGVDLP